MVCSASCLAPRYDRPLWGMFNPLQGGYNIAMKPFGSKLRGNKAMCKQGRFKFYATLSLGLALGLGLLLGLGPQQALADSNNPTATPVPSSTIAVTLPPTDTPIPTSTATQGAAGEEDTAAKGLETSPVEDAVVGSQEQAVPSQAWTSSIPRGRYCFDCGHRPGWPGDYGLGGVLHLPAAEVAPAFSAWTHPASRRRRPPLARGHRSSRSFRYRPFWKGR